MNDALTEARFWAQVSRDAARTVVCNPDLESRCKSYVQAAGVSHLITVLPNPMCPPNRLYVIDQNAIEAGLHEATSGPIRWPLH